MAPNFFAKLQIFSETTHYIDARKAISGVFLTALSFKISLFT